MAEQIHIFNAGKRVALVRNGVTEYVNRVDFAIEAIDANTVQISNENFDDYLVINYANVLHPEASSASDLVARVESLIDLRQPNYASGDGDTLPFCLLTSIQEGDILVWDGTNWVNQKPRFHYLSNFTPDSNDANTNEKVLQTIQVAAGIVSPGDIIEFFSQFQVTASANNKTFRVYIDATGDLTGAILIGTFTTSGAAVQMSPLYRFLPVLTDTSIEALASASTSVTGNYSQPNAVNTQIAVPSLSAGFYIVITGQKANAGETLTCRWTQITIKKQAA